MPPWGASRRILLPERAAPAQDLRAGGRRWRRPGCSRAARDQVLDPVIVPAAADVPAGVVEPAARVQGLPLGLDLRLEAVVPGLVLLAVIRPRAVAEAELVLDLVEGLGVR